MNLQRPKEVQIARIKATRGRGERVVVWSRGDTDDQIPIVTSAVALLLSIGQPVESPTISTPSAADDYSMLADPDIPNPESVRHKSELAWHAWRASIQDPEDCVVMCWEQHVDQTHVAPLAPFRPINERGAGSHAHPWAGSCDDKHPPCGQDGGGPSELI